MDPEPEELDWHYEPSKELDQPLVERLKHFPREPEMFVYALRSLAALAMRAWLRVYHRLSIEGRENLPQEGSFILAANHASHLDALCLMAALPLRKLHRAFPAAASDYFFVSLPRTAASAALLNALPFHRGAHANQSLAMCREVLKNPGNILILFPEGTRTLTGEMGSFKPGIGALAAGTEIPIIPCHLKGVFEAWPKGRSLPKPTKIRLRIGSPRSYEQLEASRESAKDVAQDLRQAIMGLAEAQSGNPYSPEN